ncbi:MAG: hypothetical protein JXR69_02375 [Candidatus Delongbacteria bacterium]|nr:hypothetical protein [Candidatus Delongbacteria bacterium]
MKVYKQITSILLIAFITMAFSRSAQTAPSSVDGLQTGQDSKAIIPTPNNRVHRAGLLWLNMNNMGYFGNPSAYDDPCTGKNAVSGEMPGGSGTDFLFAGALLFGGYKDSADVNVSVDGTDIAAKVFQGPLATTAYEGWSGNPMPTECWPVKFDEDEGGSILGRMYETSNVEGRISCLFEEVYDPAATAEEQFNTMFTDKLVQRTPYTGMDEYDNREHIPLGIEVRQKSYAWSYDYAQKFIIIDYTLYNRGEEGKDLYDFFMGVYLDCDIGMIGGEWEANSADDLGGFIQKWDGYIDPATNTQKTVELNLAWAADNDGRNYTGPQGTTATGEPGAGAPLDGATGIVTVRVLRNPNPNLRYAFNMYIAEQGDEALDWGPHWKTGLHPRPLEDHPSDPSPSLLALPWKYDLTPFQKGYDDYNQDDEYNGTVPLAGGRVEGRPAGDKGKFMIMSNDEFDYNQYDIIDVDNHEFSDPEYMIGTPYAQAEKWQEWLDPSEPLPSADDVHDGDLKTRNDIANGADTKYILSFGPLGTEKMVNVAIDRNLDGILDDVLQSKTVWEFAHGDSLKLTLAFIVNDNFHTSLDQDPNYATGDDTARYPDSGIDPAYYDKGWYDAFYNVVWAERVYDIPMHDTIVDKFDEEKGDGWYGEDVGSDGIYANTKVTTECWWTTPVSEYGGPDDDDTEGNSEIDAFTTSFVDPWGFTGVDEDHFLPYGMKTLLPAVDPEGVYGITGNQEGGGDKGYGYMVVYDNLLNPYPGITPGEWVRYGFDNGRIDKGDGVPDFTGPPPPPSPKIKISYENNDVVVEWASKEFFLKEDGTESYSGPEEFLDPFTRVKDFEGYQIQVSPNSNSLNYVEIFSVDKDNYIYERVDEEGDYLESPYSAQEIADSLAAGNPFPVQITSGGNFYELVPFADNRDILASHIKEGMYEYTATPATRTIDSVDVDYYKYKFVLQNKLYAKESYIAVTSSDFGDPKSGTPALKSNPAINGSSVIPTKLLGTEDVVVVPNPYRGDTDYESLGWENVDGADDWKEQDRKIVFMNIPLRSVIKIYTLAGDLVKTIGHNGNARVDARYQYGEYGAAWDLINDNDQAVVSGIYLYSVKDVDDDSYEFIGKFVIIK